MAHALSSSCSGEAVAECVPPGAATSQDVAASLTQTGASMKCMTLAIAVGALLGAGLAAANVYTGLKIAYVDSGAIAASLLAFVLLRAWGRDAASTWAVNLAQVTASTAASMVAVMGLAGPLPALAMAGLEFSSGVIIGWGCLLGWLGLWIGWALRGLLLDRARLPFPTGIATAGVIRAIEGDARQRSRHLVILVSVGSFAALWTYLRDGAPGWVPPAWVFPGTIAAVEASTLGVGISLSPLVAATGGLVGSRASASAVLGGIVAWLVAVPWLVRVGIVEPGFDVASQWLVWPALGFLLGGTLTSFLADRALAYRAFQDLRMLWSRRSSRLHQGLLGLSLATGVALLGVLGLRLSLVSMLVSLGLSTLFALLCARAAGETDVAPVGTAGTVGQLMAASDGMRSSLFGGGVVAGVAASTAQALWSLRASGVLGVRMRPVAVAQVVGVVVGAVAAIPAFQLVQRVYGVGTTHMPAWGAQSWRATAEALARDGALPPAALVMFWVALVLGIALSLLLRSRPLRWLPTPIGLGIGMMVPLSFSVTMLLGAVTLKRMLGRRFEAEGVIWMGAAIAGESLTAVALAICY